ncbi:hypothetical protein EIP91_008074 [Steccherinum ochraceum]|uniref:Uncharacterized protein n=1 Tax=Steccherinum ochraceum TaxID=92696 RepID=A0A4R0RYG9_9APHY|nr:hypothetical protein EIP91_008074 [Steccherinum ochraceum]
MANLVAPPPTVSKDSLELFQRYGDPAGPVSTSTLLALPETSSQRESTCIHYLELCIGSHMQKYNARSTLRNLPTARSVDELSSASRWIMYTLARVATCPILYDRTWLQHYGPNTKCAVSVKSSIWWMRKHICIRPSTHLQDDANMKHAVAELVSAIKAKAGLPGCHSPSVVYGFAFSLLDCVVVRVDLEKDGNFQYTEAMDFLPDAYADVPSTPGITALARLGLVPAIDDAPFYRTAILQANGESQTEDISPASPTSSDAEGFPDKPFPTDILFKVAQYIEDPRSLCDFALASSSAMIAALPWLKYPQPRVTIQIETEGPSGLPLKSTRRAGGLYYSHSMQRLLVHECTTRRPTKRNGATNDHLWAGHFYAMYDGREIKFTNETTYTDDQPLLRFCLEVGASLPTLYH